MSIKGKRLVITGKNKEEMLRETRNWIETLQKEVSEERRNKRTRGLILMGAALLSAIEDEDRKFGFYEQFIEIDTLLKSNKVDPVVKTKNHRSSSTSQK